MGANAQTSVPTFTAGDVLTAANMNISARTGVPVFSNTTTRDAGFGGTGEKTLAEGQLCYLEDSNVVQYYDGASWATVGPASAGALVRTGGGTMSASSSTTVSSVFSSSYHAYRIVISNMTASSGNAVLNVQLDGITTGYRWNAIRYQGTAGTASASFDGDTSASVWRAGQIQTTATGAIIEILNPNLAAGKLFVAHNQQNGGNYEMATTFGVNSSTTQATGVVISAGTGNFTGTINVYGYALS